MMSDMEPADHPLDIPVELDALDPERKLRRMARQMGVKLDTRGMRPPNPTAEARAESKRERRRARRLADHNAQRRAEREAGEL